MKMIFVVFLGNKRSIFMFQPIKSFSTFKKALDFAANQVSKLSIENYSKTYIKTKFYTSHNDFHHLFNMLNMRVWFFCYDSSSQIDNIVGIVEVPFEE